MDKSDGEKRAESAESTIFCRFEANMVIKFVAQYCEIHKKKSIFSPNFWSKTRYWL